MGLAAVLSAVPVSPASAADIALVDYQLIFDRFEGTADAQRTLDRELKEWDARAKEMREEIERLESEKESQKLMLSEERLREKEEEVRNLKNEYQEFAESIWGVNGQAAKRNAELTAPIAEKILNVVARIGEEKNVDIIFDASTGGVVWAKDDVNLTQLVLDDLSLGLREEGAPAEGDPESPPESGSTAEGGSSE
jgi:Skp family chaperone for outer membrane proteins